MGLYNVYSSQSGVFLLKQELFFNIRGLSSKEIKMSYAAKSKVQKVMVLPINLIFRFLQSRARVQIWLYENQNLRIEGHIIGFDEYMNVMLEQAEEVHMKKGTRKPIGRILLKGDNITLIQNTQPDGTNM